MLNALADVAIAAAGTIEWGLPATRDADEEPVEETDGEGGGEGGDEGGGEGGGGGGGGGPASGVPRALEGRRVLVVGGGQSAGHLAIFALGAGAAHVTVAARRRVSLKPFDVDFCMIGEERGRSCRRRTPSPRPTTTLRPKPPPPTFVW